jgi:phage shock protein A
MSFCEKLNDVVTGSSSSSWRGGEEENADTAPTLQEELYEVKKDLTTLKANMATIIENQVENRVNATFLP